MPVTTATLNADALSRNPTAGSAYEGARQWVSKISITNY